MTRTLQTIVAASTLVLFSACTQKAQVAPVQQQAPTIESHEFSVSSVPAGALVRFSTGEQCRTPCIVRRTSTEPFAVTISKEGYKSTSVEIINNLEALKRFNKRRGLTDQELQSLRVQKLTLTPNPVKVTLEPDMML